MTKLKRTTHKSEGFTEKQIEGFTMLSHKASVSAPEETRSATHSRDMMFAECYGRWWNSPGALTSPT